MRLEETATSSGICIYSSSKGRLLVVAGGPGISSRAYRECFEPLSKSARLVFWDFRGTGKTPELGPFGAEYDYQDLLQVLRHVGEPLVILSHSYGSVLALRLALEFPEKVKGLIFVGGALSFSSVFENLMERKRKNLSETDFKALLAMMEAIRAGDTSDALSRDFMRREVLNQLHRPSAIQIHKFCEICELNLKAYCGNQDFLALDYTNQAREITAPTLVISGADDLIVPREFSSKIANLVRNAHHEVISNCGHWPFFEHPESFFKTVNYFLPKT